MLNFTVASWQDVVFVAITLLWWLEFRIFPSRKRNINVGNPSFKIILVAILFSIFAGILFLRLRIAVVPEAYILTAKTLGIFIYFIGIVLRYWCAYLLGKNFTRGASVHKDLELISSGPYKRIRNPLYLGLLLLTLGVPVYLGSILGV